MKTYVVDTSVVVWAFLEDQQKAKVELLLSKAIVGKIKLVAPSLLWYEFFSVMVKCYHSDVEALACLKAFSSLVEDGIITLFEEPANVEAVMIAHSVATGSLGHIGPGDACFHGLALRLGCDFLTNDKKHYNKTKNSIGHVVLFEDLKLSA